MGTSIATKQAPSIGNSMVTLAVISTTRTMPVSRGSYNACKESRHADDSEPCGLNVEIRECEAGEQSKEKP